MKTERRRARWRSLPCRAEGFKGQDFTVPQTNLRIDRLWNDRVDSAGEESVRTPGQLLCLPCAHIKWQSQYLCREQRTDVQEEESASPWQDESNSRQCLVPGNRCLPRACLGCCEGATPWQGMTMLDFPHPIKTRQISHSQNLPRSWTEAGKLRPGEKGSKPAFPKGGSGVT